MEEIIRNTQVSVRFFTLHKSDLPQFIDNKFNPEIAVDAVTLEKYSLDDFRQVADKLHENGLIPTIHAPFIDLSPGSSDPEIWKITRYRFEQVLKLVRIFRPKTVVCHAGYDRKRYDFFRDVWIEKSLEMWAWFGGELRAEGSRLMLENVYEHGPEDIHPLFENLEAQDVGFCLDMGHQKVFSKTHLETWLESLGPYLGQVHLHDNFGKADDHVGLGKGVINFQPLFDYVRTEKKRLSAITLEIHKEGDLWPSFEYLKKHRPFQ